MIDQLHASVLEVTRNQVTEVISCMNMLKQSSEQLAHYSLSGFVNIMWHMSTTWCATPYSAHVPDCTGMYCSSTAYIAGRTCQRKAHVDVIAGTLYSALQGTRAL